MDLSGRLGKKTRQELGKILGPTKASGLLRLLSKKGCNPEDISISGGRVSVTLQRDALDIKDNANLRSFYGFSVREAHAGKEKQVFYKDAV